MECKGTSKHSRTYSMPVSRELSVGNSSSDEERLQGISEDGNEEKKKSLDLVIEFFSTSY